MNVFKQLYSKLLWIKTGFKTAFFSQENASVPTKSLEQSATPQQYIIQIRPGHDRCNQVPRHQRSRPQREMTRHYGSSRAPPGNGVVAKRLITVPKVSVNYTAAELRD